MWPEPRISSERRVRAGEVAGRESGGSGGPPTGDLGSVDQRQVAASFAIDQQVAGRDGAQAAGSIAGEDCDQLGADEAAGMPGRHQEQGGSGAVGLWQVVAVTQGRFGAGDEGLAQCGDQPVERQAGARAFRVDDEHWGGLAVPGVA